MAENDSTDDTEMAEKGEERLKISRIKAENCAGSRRELRRAGNAEIDYRYSGAVIMYCTCATNEAAGRP